MTQQDTQPPAETLAECPLCGRYPKRNGRVGTGGVLCAGDNVTVGMIHRFQTYGANQAEADAAWNAFALTRRAGGDAIPAGEVETIATAVMRYVTPHLKHMIAFSTLCEAIEQAYTPKPPAGGDAGAVGLDRATLMHCARVIRDRAVTVSSASLGGGYVSEASKIAARHLITAVEDMDKEAAALALPAPVVEEEARFLCDRLAEFEREITDEDAVTEFYWHVAPSVARLRAALSEGRSHG